MGNVLFCSKICRGIKQTQDCTVDRKCPKCGKDFKNPLNREKKGEGKFCSDQCRLDSWREIDRPGKNKGQHINCVECGKEFYNGANETRKFCSNSCFGKSINKQQEFHCLFCGSKFLKKPSQIKIGQTKFCSKKCYHKYNYFENLVNCTFCKKEIHKSPSFFKNSKNPFCSIDCSRKYYSGKNSPSWRGGVTPERKKIRDSKQYKEWRKQVFERDNYTCQKCGAKNGNGKAVYLHAHHIKSFHNFPELRFEIDNGVTMCEECHKLTDNFGMKAKKDKSI